MSNRKIKNDHKSYVKRLAGNDPITTNRLANINQNSTLRNTIPGDPQPTTGRIFRDNDNTIVVETDKAVYVTTNENITEQKFITNLEQSGYSGMTGSSGPEGISGYSGLSGWSGPAGGPQGISGYSGQTGSNGLSGFSGRSGASGATGPAGSAGSTGASGQSGFSGQAGTASASGYSGERGASGYSGSPGPSGGASFTVINSGASAYTINGSNNPTLNLIRGFTYYFNVNATGHPFWIKTAQVTGTGSDYSTGVTNNGTSNGTVTFQIPFDAPSTLYYICQFHASMTGVINISDVGPSGFSGYSGSVGPAGTSGYSGMPGSASASGYSGAVGASGYSGAPGAGSVPTRTTASSSTSSIANGATENIQITGFKSYALLKIQTSAAAWVRIYTDVASRTADASRTQTTDPTPGSGVISEVITVSGTTILMSPGLIGFNNEATPTTSIPLAVTNNSGSTASITVTLTLIKIED